MQRAILAIFFSAAVIAGAWRFVDLSRDPDDITQTSQDAWGDPAVYLYNARSFALFREWRTGEGVAMFVTPGYSFLAAFWFSLFGASYLSAVKLSTLAGFVVVAGTAAFAGVTFENAHWKAGRRCAAAAAISLLCSYVLFVHQHIPVGDMEALAVSTLAALGMALLQTIDPMRFPGRFRLVATLAGLGIALAPFMKLHNGIFSAAAVAAWISSGMVLGPEWKTRRRQATPWLAAGLALAAALLLVWAAWLYAEASPEEIARQVSRLRAFSVTTAQPELKDYDPKAAFAFTRYFRTNLLYRQPVETALALLGLIGFIGGRRREWPLYLASVWWVVAVAALSSMGTDALRYRLIAWPAVVVLAANVWERFYEAAFEPLTGYARLSLAAGSGLVFGSLGVYLAAAKTRATPPATVEFLFFAGAALLGYAAVLLMAKLPQKPVALVLAVLMLSVDFPQWVIGERRVSHDLLEVSRELEKFSAAEYLVSGGWGVRLALPTGRNAYLGAPRSPLPQIMVIDEVVRENSPKGLEVERHRMKKYPLELVFIRIDPESKLK